MWVNLIAIILLSSLLISFIWIFAPWVPTRKKDYETINHLSNLKPGQNFLEIGCGDGRVAAMMARQNPKCQIIGVELFWPVFIAAKIRQFFWKLPNLSIQLKNAYWINWSPYNVVYVFGIIDTLNGKIKQKALNEMKPGSKLISYAFEMKQWPGKTQQKKSSVNQKLSISSYEVPTKP